MEPRILFILLASALYNVCYGSTTQNIDNYSDTLIRVGNVTVSNSFFKRDIRNYITSTHVGKIDSAALDTWYHRYLDNLLLTNCAIDKGILKRADVEKSSIGFENYVLIQKGSSFYQANINAKIRVSSDELHEAYRRMSDVISFSLIRFSSQSNYLATLKGKKISRPVFEQFKGICNDSIEYSSNQLVWPSLRFWPLQHHIASLKTGEISGPVIARNDEFSDAIYLIQIDSVRPISKQTFELEKPKLEFIIRQIKEDSLYNRYERAILQKAAMQLKINKITDSLVQCIVNHWTDPKEIYFRSYLKTELMRYVLNGKPCIVHCHDLLTYYRNLPIRPNLRNRNDVICQLYYYVLSSYMVQNASIANFDKEPRFVSLKKDLRNKFGLQKLEEELFNKISVSEDESLAYYQKHKLDFKENSSANITLFTFDSETDALITAKELSNADSSSLEEKAKDKVHFPKIKSCFSNTTLQYADSLKSPIHLIKQILEAKDNTFCGPFTIGKQIVLVYKKGGLDYRQKTYTESKNQIYSYLKEQKFMALKEDLLKQAHQKYSFYQVPSLQQVKDIITTIR